MIEINGIIDPDGKPLDPDTFCTEFLQWVESKGWYFAGSIGHLKTKMTTTDKNKTISSILKLTKKTGNTKYFDKLCDLNEGYLQKLHSVVKNLKKAK